MGVNTNNMAGPAAKLIIGHATKKCDSLKIRMCSALLDVSLTMMEPKPDQEEAKLPPPVLLHDGKPPLVSTPSICKYLVETFGTASLMPKSLEQYRAADKWIDWCSYTLAPLIERNNCDKQLAELDSELGKSAFLTGSDVTLADIWAYCTITDENGPKDLNSYGNILKWSEKIAALEPVALLLKNIAKKEAKDKAKTKMIDTNPPSGTRDMFPENMRFRTWLFNTWRQVGKRFGFQEYDAPVLENEDLYKRKAGEEITQQMYNFVDKEGHRVTLRPEMTPTLARMVLSLTREATGDIAAIMPLKWFSIPQCWRFETTQRGRKREHYQWNMDIVGIKGITAELEVLAAAVDFCKAVGLTSKDIGIKVNSRKVLGAVVETAGVPKEQFAPVCVIIDKLDKIGDECVKHELMNIGLDAKTADTIIASTGAESLDKFAEISGTADSDEVKELRELFVLAKDYGIDDWLQFDASVVRGLAYYTGVVFEGFDRSGVMRAIFGGGRYDRLMSLYGSKKEMPCVGFGFGDCVIEELLKVTNKMPDFPAQIDYVVAAYSKDMMGPSMKIASELRRYGFVCDLMQEVAKKVGKAFSYADRVGADKIIFVGPDEYNNGLVRVKNLREEDENLKQKDIPITDLCKIEQLWDESAPAREPLKGGKHADKGYPMRY